LKISRGGKSQLVVPYQVATNPCCGPAAIPRSLISHLTGRETTNIPKTLSGVHGFTGKTVTRKPHLRLGF